MVNSCFDVLNFYYQVMRIHGIAVYLILFGLIGVGKSFLLDGGNTGILINAIGDGKEDIDQAIARSFELVKHLSSANLLLSCVRKE